MRLSLSLIALALTIGLIAQNQSKPKFQDKSGRYAMWFEDASFEFPDKDTIVFDVTGKPVEGRSQAQNLQFVANQVTGTLKKLKNGDYLLSKGTATGNAAITVTDESGTSVLKSARINLVDNQETATATLPGSFTATNTLVSEKVKRRALSMQGTSGTFVMKSLATKDENPILSADIVGPITIKVDQIDAKDRTTVATITGGRATMRAEGKNKVMTVTGGVKIVTNVTDPEKPGFEGELNVASAVVTFDENFEITKVSTKGSPGTGTLKEKKDGS